MNREIKFRAWDEIGEWMGNVTSFDFDEGAVFIETKHSDDENRFEINNVPVMQYTGLKDDNGKEIYEGDIVKTHDQNNVIEYEHGSFLVKGLHEDEDERTYSVLYHYLVDATIPDMPHTRFDGVTTDLEVVGNIYENPELLEVSA